MKPQSRKSLVLGASGKIGYLLCERLGAEGFGVVGAARFRDQSKRDLLRAMGVQTVTFDALTDQATALPDVDLVFLEIWDPSQHGGKAGPDAIWSLNYEAVGRVVSRYAGTAIINGCSGNVYGIGPDPMKESGLCRPNDEYGLARFAQEKLIDFLCDQAGGRAVHLRYYHSNTPKHGLIRRTADAVLARRSLGSHPDRLVQVIGLDDFVRGTMLAAEKLQVLPRAINICHPKIWTIRQLAQILRDELGDGEVVFDDDGGRDKSVIGDPSLMIEHFGEPTEDLDDLIRRTCAAARCR